MTLQELLVKVSADIANYANGMDAVLRKSQDAGAAMGGVTSHAEHTGASVDKLGLHMMHLGMDLETAGKNLTMGITAPLAAAGLASLKFAGDIEQTSVAFQTMLGSAEAAQEHLEALKDFALKTPFQFSDLVLASKRLQALGFSAKEVIPTLTAVGNATAALGSGAEGIQRITTAIGQMQAKGKVQAEEMKQLAEAGIPAWQILAKTLNTDVAGAMKQVEARTVDAAKAIPALLAGMNEKFGGLMEAQSKTLLGQIAKAREFIEFTFQDIGKSLMPMAKNVLEGFVQPALLGVKDLAAGFARLDPVVQQSTVAILAITAAVGPALLVMGKMVSTLGALSSAFGTLPALLNPVTLAIVALGTAAGVAWMEFSKGTAALRSLDEEFGKYISGMVQMEAAAGNGDFAQKKLNEALAAGAIGVGDYTKAMEMLTAAQNKASGTAITGMIRDMGLSFSVVSDGAAKAAAGVADLTKKQTELENEVSRTRAVLQEAQKQYAQHAISASVLAKAHDDYKKALDAAAGSQKSTVLSVSELAGKQAFLNAEVVRAEAVFRQMEERYRAGTIGAAELARAEEQLNAAIKAATASGTDWISVYNSIINAQQTAAKEAEAAVRAYLQIVLDYKAGSAEVGRAQDLMTSKLQAAGAASRDIVTRLIKEMGGYTVEVVKAGQAMQQAFIPGGQALKGFGAALDAVSVKGTAAVDAVASGIQRSIVLFNDGAKQIEVYTGSVTRAGAAWNATGNAIQSTIAPTGNLVDLSEQLAPNFEEATGSVYDLADALSSAARIAASLNDMASWSPGRVKGVMGTYELFDPSDPDRGGWTIGNYAGGFKMEYIPPAEYGRGTKGRGAATVEEPLYSAHSAEDVQETLNDQLLAMIAAGAALDQILAFATRIGAYVAKDDLGKLLVQFKGSTAAQRVEYQEMARAAEAISRNTEEIRDRSRDSSSFYDNMAGAVGGVAEAVSNFGSGVVEAVQSSFRDLGEVVTGAITSAAQIAVGVAEVMAFKDLGPMPAAEMPSVAAPQSARQQMWLRDLSPAEMATLSRTTINVTGNVFRSREDEDYMVRLVQERLA